MIRKFLAIVLVSAPMLVAVAIGTVWATNSAGHGIGFCDNPSCATD